MVQTLDIRQKARWRRAMYAKPTILILLVLLFFVASGTWGMFQKSSLARANAAKAELELAELRQRETELSRDIVGLSTDRGIEEEIRGRFMVAKEGEKVIVISDPLEEAVHTVTVTEKDDAVPFLAGLGGVE